MLRRSRSTPVLLLCYTAAWPRNDVPSMVDSVWRVALRKGIPHVPFLQVGMELVLACFSHKKKHSYPFQTDNCDTYINSGENRFSVIYSSADAGLRKTYTFLKAYAAARANKI